MIKQPCLAGTKDKVIVVDRDEKVLDKDQIMKNLKCQAREGFGLVSWETIKHFYVVKWWVTAVVYEN